MYTALFLIAAQFLRQGLTATNWAAVGLQRRGSPTSMDAARVTIKSAVLDFLIY
jgi:hypothetical protein